MNPRRITFLAAGLLLAAGAVWRGLDHNATANPDELPSDPIWTLADDFKDAVIDRFEVHGATADETIALLNHHAGQLSRGSRTVRFVRWSEGDPFPPGLEKSADREGSKTPGPDQVVIPGLDSLTASEIPAPVQAEHPPFDLKLANIPIMEAARYVAGMADLDRHAIGDTVWLFSPAEAQRIAVTKTFYLLDSILFNPQLGTGLSATGTRADLRSWLSANGVALRGSDAAYYERDRNVIVVHALPEEIDLVETIISPTCGMGPARTPWERQKIQAQYFWNGVVESVWPPAPPPVAFPASGGAEPAPIAPPPIPGLEPAESLAN